MKYMLILEKIIQQIILQKDGDDADPSAALLNIDMRSIINDLANATGGGSNAREAEEKYRKVLEKSRKLERELADLREQEIRNQNKPKEDVVKDLKKRIQALEDEARKPGGTTFLSCKK